MRGWWGLAVVGLALAAPGGQGHFSELGQQASRLRQLGYRDVKYQLTTQKECTQYLLRLLDQEMEPARTRRRELFYQQLGLMPRTAHLKSTLATLYGEQVRGLYDPAQKRYLVVKSEGNPSDQLAAAMGLNMEDILTVHELGHAIQDQHFDLSRMFSGVAEDFDRELAVQTLVEGDASVLMMQFALAKAGLDAEEVGDLGGLSADQMMIPQGGAMATAPPLFQHLLSFPYGQGMVFVSALKKRGGWRAVDRAFSALPESSEQVLHPEKYPNDHPQKVQVNGVPPAGFTSLGQDTAGEFLMRQWAEVRGQNPDSCNGWGGDRYEVFSNGAKTQVCWQTAWDNERSARAFEKMVQGVGAVDRQGRNVLVKIGP